jgi:hypothetical protein
LQEQPLAPRRTLGYAQSRGLSRRTLRVRAGARPQFQGGAAALELGV